MIAGFGAPMTFPGVPGLTIMGLIQIELFASLDLVGQAPGGPDEDPVGFAFGGAGRPPLLDDITGAQVTAAYDGTDACCSEGGPMTSSRPTGRTRTATSPTCSIASRSTCLPRQAEPRLAGVDTARPGSRRRGA